MSKIKLFIVVLLSISLLLTSCNNGTEVPSNTFADTTVSEATSEFIPETTSDPYELIEVPKPEDDPYATVSEAEFYADYESATDYWDSFYRTQHGFMSGSIEAQDQAPTIAENRPSEEGVYLRNTSALYSYDGHAYTVLDANGDIAFTVYEGGGYVTLEEVAAYVFAFGDVPANYTADKKGSPSSSRWGKYLRCNHSAFSGSTSKYPYEPELPDISGCGGSLYYYEIDIGTTGTDCDPKYTAYKYNDGTRITRGAARIVYARYDANRNEITDPGERYLFYTYNHYNDFMEYLNYEGGWGEIFGNITGGGQISSKTNCNPTPYVPTEFKDFRDFKTTRSMQVSCIVWIMEDTKEKFYVYDQI